MKKLIVGEKRAAMAEMISSGGLNDKNLESKSASAIETEGKSKGYVEGDKFIITWAMGHLFTIEIPERVDKTYKLFAPMKDSKEYAMEKLKDAPFVPDTDQSRYDKVYQKDTYDMIPYKEKQYQRIIELLKRKDIDEIILFADADAEGERISREPVEEQFSKIPHLKNMKITRAWNAGSFKAKIAIEKSLADRKSYKDPKYDNLFYSARARSKNDYIVGMKMTKVLSETYKRFLPTGRVQAPILALLLKREKEIENFKPKPFWKLNGYYKDLDFEHFYYSEDVNDEGKPIKVKEQYYWDKIDLDTVVKECEDKKLIGKVLEFKKSEKSTTKPLMYSTNTFQSDFMTKYRESIEMADLVIEYLRDEGFTTYPRTNGHYFSDDDIEEVKESLKTALKVFEKEKIVKDNVSTIKVDKKNDIFNNAKAKTQNHTPLSIKEKIPTTKDFDKWDSGVFYKGKKLKHVKEGYFLIAQRFMIQFLPDDLIERQNLLIEINGHLFETTGEKPLRQGWRELTGELKKDTSFSTDLKKGDTIQLESLKVSEGLTKKPPMYTVISLQKMMVNVGKSLDDEILSIENREERIKKKEEYKELKKIFKEIEGIGTNATRKDIIMTLSKRKFIEIKGTGQEIKLTDNGIFLTERTPEYLKQIKTTALWEIELEKIRLGEMNYETFINNLDTFYIKNILPDVLKSFDKEKDTLFKPSEKQVSFAEKIAKEKGIDLPKICYTDRREISKFIDENMDKSTYKPSSDYKKGSTGKTTTKSSSKKGKSTSKTAGTSTGSDYKKDGAKSYPLSDKQKGIAIKYGIPEMKALAEKSSLTDKENASLKKWLDGYFKGFKK